MEPVTDWDKRYQDKNTAWDIGKISTPIKEYIDQLQNKSIKILIPGGGNGHEAAYLFQEGFTNVFLLDIAPSPLETFSLKYPDFPKEQIIQANYFDHQGEYDLIIEQTFFCAIDPKDRAAYVEKASELLLTKGKLMGLLWSVSMNSDRPPYGGNKSEYLNYFDPFFNYKYFEEAYNSIKPRMGRELFLVAERK